MLRSLDRDVILANKPTRIRQFVAESLIGKTKLVIVYMYHEERLVDSIVHGDRMHDCSVPYLYIYVLFI